MPTERDNSTEQLNRDMPTAKGKSAGGKRGKKKKAMPFGCSSRAAACILVCLLCCAVVFVAAGWDDLAPESLEEWFSFSGTSEDDFPVSITGSAVLQSNMTLTDSGIAYISDTTILCMDNSGEVTFSSQHSYINPAIKTSGDFSVAYNAGGSGFKVFSTQEELYDGTQGTSIADCDITSKGIYAVVSDGTGYLSELNVYDEDNELLYSYSFNDYYALNVSLNAAGTMAAVGCVNVDGGEMVTRVYILDFTQTEPVGTFDYNDQIVYDVEYIAENKAAVLTDSLVAVIDDSKADAIVYSFNGRVLTSYDFLYDTGAAVSLSQTDDGRDCTMVVLDTDGYETDSFSTSLKVTSVSLYNDRMALLASNTLYLYDFLGDEMGTYDAGSDAKAVLLAAKSQAYVLGISEIRLVSLK